LALPVGHIADYVLASWYNEYGLLAAQEVVEVTAEVLDGAPYALDVQRLAATGQQKKVGPDWKPAQTLSFPSLDALLDWAQAGRRAHQKRLLPAIVKQLHRYREETQSCPRES